jgi:hypothetical protein
MDSSVARAGHQQARSAYEIGRMVRGLREARGRLPPPRTSRTRREPHVATKRRALTKFAGLRTEFSGGATWHTA